MKQYKIFVVDDDPIYAKLISYQLTKNPDYDVEIYADIKSCIKNLHRSPDLITLDYFLPDGTGKELLQKFKEFNSDLPVIIISGQSDIPTAIGLLKLGAYDYIVKDDDTITRLWNAVKNAREQHDLKEEVAILREEIGKKFSISKGIIGSSSVMKKVFAIMEKAIKSNITVSISGETGTGKEVVAKAIHYNSKRSKKPFVVVNVSAIPEDLIESEMFGHEKGAFTGADKKRIGKFELAEGGTLFLDEIGEMSLAMQAKLLRVIQERELNRVGGNETINIDVRIIIATNKDLHEEVGKKLFREDLYYRLLGLPIELPPLRNRGNDKMLLSKYFIKVYCKENSQKMIAMSTGAQAKILNYSFPGNVRELKAVIELASVLSENNIIQEDDISFRNINTLTDVLSFDLTLEEYNSKIINSYIKKYEGNITAVAKALNIGKSTIYRMKKSGVI
ncbi:MAG: sigma-54-dependent Fis family transcriptional regulator [Bacteroidetes bacterium]|nr:MAG: sigma-54-dependent Fis family transcriptional regulator [Bacteroidota bacterium]